MNIRIVKTSDAEELVEYINKISGESNFLTFGEGNSIKLLKRKKVL